MEIGTDNNARRMRTKILFNFYIRILLFSHSRKSTRGITICIYDFLSITLWISCDREFQVSLSPVVRITQFEYCYTCICMMSICYFILKDYLAPLCPNFHCRQCREQLDTNRENKFFSRFPRIIVHSPHGITTLFCILKGVLNNFSHFGSARLFLFIFASYIKHLLIYDIW